MNKWLDQPDAHMIPVVAAAYDSSTAIEFDPDVIGATVDLLAELADLAGGGRANAAEFAIGTGRIGLPLAARGVAVHGIDASEPMLAQLKAKPGADAIGTTVGDMTETAVGDDFALVYLVYNTIMNLRSQDAQVACFVNAARHLRPGGRFVIETMVPELRRLSQGETILPFDVSPHHLGFDEYVDFAEQILVSHHYHLASDGTARNSAPAFRYVWPSELDLMARLAGLELESRWGDWDRSPFTGDSTKHVSVWRKPG